ncbi:MAG: DUF4189 domain-containing protein [Burkholderiales bacterium]
MYRLLTFAAALMLALPQAGDAAARRKPGKPNWGAIAYNTRTGAFGYAVDAASKRNAETEAFRQCGSDCDLIRTFRNACGAVAARPKKAAWDTGASREIAERKALTRCGGDACKIAVWACTREK